MAQRVKVSVTLDEEVLAAVDAEAARSERPNRSQVVESVLRAWSRERRRRALDDAIESWYRGQTSAEAAEAAEWAELGDEAVPAWDEP